MRDTTQHILKVGTLIVFLFLAGIILEEFLTIVSDEVIETVAELFTVFVSFSIFGMTWFSYPKSKDRHALFLGAVFFVVGFLDLFHTLSYPFMPEFITANSSHKAGVFWNIARSLSAPLFLVSAYIYKDSFPSIINRKILSVSAGLILAVSFIAGIFYNNFLPAIHGSIEGFNTLKIIQLSLTLLIVLYAAYLYSKRASEIKYEIFLVYGFVIVVFSDIVYFSYDLSGHLLKVAGFFFIHLALYRSSVDAPYEKLILAEDKLRFAAEDKYRNIVDNASDAIITTNLERKITSWNPASEKIFGWKAEEVMGKDMCKLVVPERLYEFKTQVFEDAISGINTFIGVETVCMRKEGSEMDAGFSLSALRDINKKITGISIIIRDITERKEYEKSLRSSRDFIKTVLDSMNDEVSIIDVRNFRIIDVNKVFLDDYGLKKEDVIGKTCYEVTHKRNTPCAAPDDVCPLTQTMQTGKYAVEEHVHWIDGEKQYVENSTSPILDENGNIVQVVHVSRDITERVNAQKALTESEEKFRTMVENSNDMIWTLDKEGNFIYFNKIAEEVTGYKLKDWAGKSFAPLIHPDDLPNVADIFKEVLNGMSMQYEVRIYGKNGDEVTLSVNSAPIKEEGTVTGTVSFGRDITRLKKMEELYIENRSLLLSEKTKSEFLAIMSHELRTPLNASIGFSELLKMGRVGKLNDEQDKYIDKVIKTNKHLLSIINGILDLTKLEADKVALEIENISVPNFIDQAVNLFEVTAKERNVSFNKIYDPALVWVDGDKVKLRQILFNLINNAIKFSKEGGGVVTITTKKEGDFAVISVADEGIGIEEDNIGKLFQEFRQLDTGYSRKYGGTGLGLAITKKLVELHGGSISVKSTFGKGSTFTFTIPLEQKNKTGKGI